MHELAAFKHVLTHKDLYLHPVQVKLPRSWSFDQGGSWFESDRWSQLGLPAPVRKPVSYTHLDVYKRQAFACLLAIILFHNCTYKMGLYLSLKLLVMSSPNS